MSKKLTFFAISIVMLVLLGTLTAAQIVSAQGGKLVLAYYFGWYSGGTWGDGRLLDTPAQPYDSLDAGAVGRHIDEARSAGIDGFVMSYYGPQNNNITQQVFGILLDQAGGRGFKAAAAVDLASGSYNATVADVTETLRHLVSERVGHPAYLRWNGKPVIYFWRQGRFDVGTWNAIREQVDPDRSTIWVMEGTDRSYLSPFDGLYLFNVAWSADFARTASEWRALTSASGGTFFSATVMPGWDESQLSGRSNPTSPRSRDGANFLINSWNGAVASGASVILVVSWNEYFENSHVEPSQVYGSVALDTLRGLTTAWKTGAPAPQTANAPTDGGDTAPADSQEVGSAESTVTDAAVTYTLVNNANLRAEPNEAAGVLGVISSGTGLPVVGRTTDEAWFQVTFEGNTGWVASDLGNWFGVMELVPVIE